MISDEELRVFKGRCGKVLLDYINRLPKSKIKKMQRKLSKAGMRLEPQGLWQKVEVQHKESQGPIRTRNGYVYR